MREVIARVTDRDEKRSKVWIGTQKDQTQAGDGKLISGQHFDSRGRLWRTQTLEDAQLSDAESTGTSGILVDTQTYESGSGRCTAVSNPYRPNAMGDPTMGWTLTNYDTMGRPVTVYGIPGSGVPRHAGAGRPARATRRRATTTRPPSTAFPRS